MRRIVYAVLCVLTFLFITGCNTGGNSSTTLLQTEQTESPETIAIKYMQDKYGLDCIVVKVNGIITGFMGDSFDQVLMRPANDPNGEELKGKEGQRYLDLVNSADQYGSTFAVYISDSEESVIGDQYMWYSVYPLFYSWINDKLNQFTPNQTGCCHILDCNTVEGQFHYCFSPRYSFATTTEELEIQLDCMNVQICAYYLESSKKMNQNDWNVFKSQLNSQYPFNYFNMRIYEVPDSIYQQALSNVAIYKMISGTDYLNSFNIDQGNSYHSYFVVDMTNLLQAWLNYVNAGASSGVGQQNFGFKWTNASPTTAAIYTGTSLTALSYYLNITYRISSAYKMNYEPQKYNRINSTIGNGSIYNFQYRMNCYGYALQVYYNGTLPTAEENAYRQRPGEFGIQYPYSSYYTTNYLDLKNYYDGFSTSFDNQTTDSGRYTVCMTYLQFIQEQMYADAASMGFTVTPYYFSGDTFNIDPASGYNANTERIIALTVYNYHRYYPGYGYKNILDYHFYVRGNDDDGSNGKKWTSKPGTEVITDKCLQSAYSNVTLNDSNINTYACYFNYCSYTPNVVRYYRITQNTDVYSHWNGYGHDDNSTGTPYCQ